MKRFCQNCGKEAMPDHKICIHCGKQLPSQEKLENQAGPAVNQNKEDKPKRNIPKKKMTKKQKMIGSAAGILIIFIIGFSIWAQNYTSPRSVEKRFNEAVSAQKADPLKKLMVHQDGSAVTTMEVKAFLKLAKQNGANTAADLAAVKPHGKFLGIYKAHKMEMTDQFAAFDRPMDGLSFTFNKKSVKTKTQNNEELVYGPLIPGIYAIEAVFEGDYGKMKKKGSIQLAQPDFSYTWIDMDIPISKVAFFVENAGQLNYKDVFIQVNDKKIPIDESGQTDEIGPFILDGSQTVTTIAKLPWGEVKSDPIKVTDSSMGLTANLITNDQYDEVKDTLKDFGEQFIQALAQKKTKPLTVAEKDVKSEIIDEWIKDDYSFTGQFNKLGIDAKSIQLQDDEKSANPMITVNTLYNFETAYHNPADTPELNEQKFAWKVGLSYNSDDKKWIIHTLNLSGYWSFEPTDEIDGSKKLQGPNKKTVAKAKMQQKFDTFTDFMYDYASASVDAINYRDFSLVSDYITKDGPRRKEAKEYIDYLDSKEIYETLINAEIEKVEEVKDNQWKITTKEEFDIETSDNTSNKTYKSVVIVKKVDDAYYVDELISTDEL